MRCSLCHCEINLNKESNNESDQWILNNYMCKQCHTFKTDQEYDFSCRAVISEQNALLERVQEIILLVLSTLIIISCTMISIFYYRQCEYMSFYQIFPETSEVNLYNDDIKRDINGVYNSNFESQVLPVSETENDVLPLLLSDDDIKTHNNIIAQNDINESVSESSVAVPQIITGVTGTTESVSFSKDGSKAFFVGKDENDFGIVTILDTATSNVVDTINTGLQYNLGGVLSTAKEQLLFITYSPVDDDYSDFYLTVMDTESNSYENIFIGQWSSCSLGNISDDEKYVYVAATGAYPEINFDSISRTMYRVNVDNLSVETSFTLPEGAAFVTESYDKSHVLLSTNMQLDFSNSQFQFASTLVVADWNDPSDEDLWQIADDIHYHFTLSVSPDKKYLYVFDFEANENPIDSDNSSSETVQTYTQTLSRYDTNTGKLVDSIVLPDAYSSQISGIYNNEKTIGAYCDCDYSSDLSYITVVDFNSMEVIGHYDNSAVSSVLAISPTNNRLYAEGSDGTLEVLDLKTGETIDTIYLQSILGTDTMFADAVSIAPDASFGYFIAANLNNNSRQSVVWFETGEKFSLTDSVTQWFDSYVPAKYILAAGIVILLLLIIFLVSRSKKKYIHSSLICPSCHCENTSVSKYCRHCGTLLISSSNSNKSVR